MKKLLIISTVLLSSLLLSNELSWVDEQVEATRKVMGGEDWKLWMETLVENDLVSDNFKTIAYSYIGPKITFPIYREGTIGKVVSVEAFFATHGPESWHPTPTFFFKKGGGPHEDEGDPEGVTGHRIVEQIQIVLQTHE